jgi:hypothetical protein
MYNMDISVRSYKIKLETIIIIILVLVIILGHTLCGCSRISIIEGMNILKEKNKKEGFVSSNWKLPTLTYSPGVVAENRIKTNWGNQQNPLPEGELLFFSKTPFKPECCPSTYSNSKGCACIDDKSRAYLRERGGNNVPYSIF